MKVTTFRGLTASYACVKTNRVDLSIQINPDDASPQAGLRRWANEQTAKALRLAERADLARAAADHLDIQHARQSANLRA